MINGQRDREIRRIADSIQEMLESGAESISMRVESHHEIAAGEVFEELLRRRTIRRTTEEERASGAPAWAMCDFPRFVWAT